MKKISLTILSMLILVVLAGCKKDEGRKFSGKQVHFEQEIIVKSQGPGTDCVQEFFNLWRRKNYAGMQTITIRSRERKFFIESMETAMVRFRKVVIKNEFRQGDDLKVELSLELTDPESIIAAAMFHMKVYGNKYDLVKAATLGPAFFGIETFMKLNQTWHLKSINGNYKINVVASDPDLRRSSNAMNYVLDSRPGFIATDKTGFIRNLSREQFISLNMSALCASCALNLGASTEEAKEWILNSKVKLLKAQESFEDVKKLFYE